MKHKASFPALILGSAVVAALLATAGVAGAQGRDAPAPADASDSPVRALFTACHVRSSCEPWITDGTREGTVILRDIRVGNSGLPHNYADLGDGRAVFTAYHETAEGAVSREPYITDGTRAGTRLVRRIGETGTSPNGYTPLGDGRFVFGGRNPRAGYMPCVWVSDGTARNTSSIACSDITWHLPTAFTPLREGQAVFAMQDTQRGEEIWITDGTRRGTRLLLDIRVGANGGAPRELVQFAEGLVLFTADDNVNGRELWATDGTVPGTRMLTSLPSSAVEQITLISPGRAVFSAGFELWVTDGTPEGTRMMADPTSPDRPRAPVEFTPLGDGRALFVAMTTNYRLWVTDGTAQGTRIVQEIDPSWRPRHLETLGDGRAVFWQWQQSLGHFALWVSDGTRRGTQRVQQFPNMTWSTEGRARTTSSMGNGLALFAYDNGRSGGEPWVTDGTRTGTRLLRDIHRTGASMPMATGSTFLPFIPAQP